jgi:hypothetical protein
VFVAVDHCNSECVGIHAAAAATRLEALEPIRQGVREYFGGYDHQVALGLKLRHDHGSQYISDHLQDEIHFLGIESSPAFVRAPEGNGVAERFIRTLKEQLLWVKSFRTMRSFASRSMNSVARTTSAGSSSGTAIGRRRRSVAGSPGPRRPREGGYHGSSRSRRGAVRGYKRDF